MIAPVQAKFGIESFPTAFLSKSGKYGDFAVSDVRLAQDAAVSTVPLVGLYRLLPLPFSHHALEPTINAETMRLHLQRCKNRLFVFSQRSGKTRVWNNDQEYSVYFAGFALGSNYELADDDQGKVQ